MTLNYEYKSCIYLTLSVPVRAPACGCRREGPSLCQSPGSTHILSFSLSSFQGHLE